MGYVDHTGITHYFTMGQATHLQAHFQACDCTMCMETHWTTQGSEKQVGKYHQPQVGCRSPRSTSKPTPEPIQPWEREPEYDPNWYFIPTKRPTETRPLKKDLTTFN